jgi:hypothetical protein
MQFVEHVVLSVRTALQRLAAMCYVAVRKVPVAMGVVVLEEAIMMSGFFRNLGKVWPTYLKPPLGSNKSTKEQNRTRVVRMCC